VCKRDADFIDNSHQVDERVRLHLFHHAGPVDLDGLFSNAQSTRDLLVGPAFNEKRQHFPLARREPRHTTVNAVELSAAREDSRRDLQRVFYRGQEVGVAHGFGQKICCTSFHCSYCCRDVAVARDEDDRQCAVRSIQFVLQFEAVYVG
jgi:hypothetical protein